MAKTRISDEFVMGATAGGYCIATFVLYFWGSAFVHYYCGNSIPDTFTPDGRAIGALFFLIPGVAVVFADWLQVKLMADREGLAGQRLVRNALWMNLAGILGFLVAVAAKYGPPEDSGGFLAVVSLLGLAFWLVGLLVSLGNVIVGSVLRVKTS